MGHKIVMGGVSTFVAQYTSPSLRSCLNLARRKLGSYHLLLLRCVRPGPVLEVIDDDRSACLCAHNDAHHDDVIDSKWESILMARLYSIRPSPRELRYVICLH
jgi:hypothetical protein